LILKTAREYEMKRICSLCGEMKDEEEFDMWFPAIRVRRYECKVCIKRETIKWWVKELIKQREREARRKNARRE
jgi:hypothetical protein